jgi:hypothetical protein
MPGSGTSRNDQGGSCSPPPPPGVPSATLVETEIPSDVEEAISQALEERDRRAVLATAVQPKEEEKEAPCLYCLEHGRKLWCLIYSVEVLVAVLLPTFLS